MKDFEKKILKEKIINRNNSREKLFHINDDAICNVQEVQLKNILDELNKYNEQRKTEIQKVSECLKEPLSLLCKSSKDLLDELGSELGQDAIEVLEQMEGSARNMYELVVDYLDASSGPLEKEYDLLDCNELMLSVLFDLSFQISQLETVFNINDLPTVYGNKSDIRHIFQTLIQNAMDSHNLVNSPQVKVRVIEKGGFWKFSISDNGGGMDSMNLIRVVAIFTEELIPDNLSGNLLGLLHCKKIVEALGGKIAIDSSSGEGTEIWFVLPKVEFKT